MANEEDLEDLEDGGLQFVIKDIIKRDKIKSIKNVEVYRRKVKKPFLKFFWYTKRIRIIRYTVNEPEFVMESLTEDLDVRSFTRLIESMIEEIEIINEQGKLVV